ncbi:SWR1-complex protein 4 [Grifola frondosa]|uniref:SWR1-complex protein 4 n=1 Tax=Grifola frondosa TaxID=5627 RepID=A0A1C7M003_GRIFR|nr:SWR1-complex protein 4 [Grifola frondosa]
MAASAADVRSILSLPNPSVAPSALIRRPSTTERPRKPEGIPRELYALIGPTAPTLAAQFTKPRLKQKPNLGSGSRVKWEWKPFKNGARTDSLELSHWAKAGADPDADYPFAKYNVQANSYVYSQDEYTRFLEDSEWTKEETDYLFNLVREYDNRFYVVGDRYDFPNGPERSLEDLKDRYYSVCRKLVRNRPWAGDEASKAQLLSSLTFDKEREVMRKKYVASLENRTREQTIEEEALYLELKRLEQNERAFKKQRDELLRTLLGIESGLADIVVDEDGLSGPPADTKKKKKSTYSASVEPQTPVTPSVISLGLPPPKKSAKSAAYDALHCIYRTDVPQTTGTVTKTTHQPVYLRSYKLPAPKSLQHPRSLRCSPN